MLLVLFLLSLLDVLSSESGKDSKNIGIKGNIQLGNSIIRVLKGTNVTYNLQIGKARIEVLDTSRIDQEHNDRD